MKALDLIEAAGQMDDRIILEVTSTMKNNVIHTSRSHKRVFVLAAAMILMLSLGIAAYAANLLGIRAFLRPDSAEWNGTEYSELSLSQPQDIPEGLDPAIAEKVNNSRAAWADWVQWCAERGWSEPNPPAFFDYEPEGTYGFTVQANKDGTGTVVYSAKDGTVLEEKFLTSDEYTEYEAFMQFTSGSSKYDTVYNACTNEHIAKLEEIASKYGLSLRRNPQLLWSSESTGQTGEGFLSNAQLAEKTAEFGNGGNIFRQTPDGFDKVYWFDEGSFAVSYYVEPSFGERIRCYGYNSMYSTLSSGTEVVSWESDLNGFTERAYTTADGTEVVILSGSGNCAYIYVYLDNSFFAEAITGSGNLSDNVLNRIADMINYSLISR